MEIGDLIHRAALAYGDRCALEDDSRKLSFKEFDQATDRVGQGLLASGLKPRDHVAVLMTQSVESVVVYYALAKSGLVRVPLNPRDTAEDHAYKIADSRSVAILRDGESGPDAEKILTLKDVRQMMDTPAAACRVPRGLDDLYRLAYTGGTTGKPKGVMLTTNIELAEISNFLIDVLPGIGPDDTMLHGAPVTHGSGGYFLPHLIRGARNVILPRFDPERFIDAMHREHATATFLVPTMIGMLLDQPALWKKKPPMRRLVYGAAPIAPSVLRRGLEAFGDVFVQIYGQAEAPMCITCLKPQDHDRIGSAGRPYTMIGMKIGDEHGQEVAVGETGEVLARGQVVMRSYWKRPEETAEKFTADGWLRTGDMGYVDEDGFLYLVDRKNDLIISGGFNVYPREVEDALMAHPQVKEAAVVGLPDEKWGDRVHAVVSLREAVSEAELLAFCSEKLAGYKRPRGLSVVDALPKSPVGKILRRKAREMVLVQAQQVKH